MRVRKSKEIQSRIQERFGKTAIERPSGKLVWIHAASNGESLSALPLIEKIKSLPSAPIILVTTMTVTGAKLMQDRLPDGCHHQFIPLDHPTWIKKFHDHWKPDLVLWVESELWPNHLGALKKNNIPAALLNARMSDKSVKKWSFAKKSLKTLLSSFDLIAAQTQSDKDKLQNLDIENIAYLGNLKDSALPLPYDDVAYDDMRLATIGRKLVLYASTHDGEEDIAFRVHQKLKTNHPDLLSVIIPRHPKRGEEIIKSFQKHDGIQIAMRSLKMSPRNNTDIYVADTLGELGLFYRLCDIVFVGNSMHVKPGGGHNLLEPALLNCAIVSGDDLFNFSTLADEMPKKNACKIVRHENDLYKTLDHLLSSPDDIAMLSQNAFEYAAKKQEDGVANIMNALNPLFEKAKLL